MDIPAKPIMRAHALIAAAILAFVAARPAAAQAGIAGTYRISVCKSAPCIPGDSANAITRGVIVLLDSAINVEALPDSARFFLRPAYLRGGAANGCIAMTPPPEPLSLAGGVRSTRWALDTLRAGRMTFTLYRSPDAGNEVIVQRRDSLLEGTGRSWGVYPNVPRFTPDTVVAMRVGPPNVAVCVDEAIRMYRAVRLGLPPYDRPPYRPPPPTATP